MKIAVDDLQAIACEYLDAQVAPKADSIQRFIAFGGLYLIGFNMKNIINQYRHVMLMLGLMDESGMIDIDLAYNAAKAGIEKAGTLTLYGFVMDASDIETIYAIAQRHGR